MSTIYLAISRLSAFTSAAWESTRWNMDAFGSDWCTVTSQEKGSGTFLWCLHVLQLSPAGCIPQPKTCYGWFVLPRGHYAVPSDAVADLSNFYIGVEVCHVIVH